MKFFKSIKWRLQLWYGLILVVVLAGFGFTAYQLERGRALGRVDDELHRRVEVLKGVLRHSPPGGPNRPFPDQPLGREDLDEPPFDGPPPGHFPDKGPPEQNPRLRQEFHLPLEAAGLFSTNDPNNFYFVIQSRNGYEIARSQTTPAGDVGEIYRLAALLSISAVTVDSATRPGQPAIMYANDQCKRWKPRAVLERIYAQGRIWVGCSITPELSPTSIKRP